MSEKNQGQKKRRTASTTEGTHSRPPASSMDAVYKESATEAPDEISKISAFQSPGYAAGGDSALAEGKESVMLCMKKIQEKARELHLKWLENFSESESFESMAIVRVDTLLKKAMELKENLQEQKQLLIAKVKNVTSILEQDF